MLQCTLSEISSLEFRLEQQNYVVNYQMQTALVAEILRCEYTNEDERSQQGKYEVHTRKITRRIR